jgi:cytochrome c oxidase subunit I
LSLLAERPAAGLHGVLGSADHKRVAALVAATAFAFFAGAGILALAMRTELAEPGLQVMSHNTYNQLFTIHGSTMIYLFVTPIALALGLYIVPLQLGASDLALGRLALLGYWLYLPGGLLMWAGFLTDQGAGSAGWFAYVPLSSVPYTPGTGMDFWVLSVILAVAAQILWGVSLLATIVRRRAPGMTMLRMAPFTWTVLVSALMVVFSFPAVIVAMSLLYLDRNGARVFEGLSGWIDYQHLFWFYGHPVVYVMFFPFVGVATEVIAVFSRKRLFGYKPFVASMLAFSAISMAVWGHHMFATGQIANRYYALTSTLLLVPAGVEYFDAAGTMVRGSLVFRTPMLFAIGFFVQFLVGGVTGIFVASPPLDYHVTDSYFVVAHFHYTLFAGSVFGLLAGVYYWFPKVTGALLREGLGRLHFGLLVVGTNLTFFPMFFLGEDGMSRRVADYPAAEGWTTLNALSSAGAGVIAVAMAVFLANVAISLRRRVPAGADPWGGHTLEWASSSPPPRHNFHALPPVRSFDPLWELRLRAVEKGAAPAVHGAAGVPELRT